MRSLSSFRLAPTVALVVAVALISTSRGPLAAQADTRERTLFVSALDDKGEPVDGLGPDAFVVREDGVRREVLRVSRATEPIDIALLVDNSQAAEHDITFIREGLAKFVASMAPKGQIAVIALADRPTILVDYTNDPKKLSDAIGRIFGMSGSGMTLLDAISETSKGLAKREGPRAAMVALFTDGPEFTNRYSRDVVSALKSAQVALNAVTVGNFYHSEEQGIRERSFLLDEGPRASGGQRIPLLVPSGIDNALQKLARDLSSQYKVVYSRPQSLIPPEKTEVSSGRTGVTMRGTPERGQARS